MAAKTTSGALALVLALSPTAFGLGLGDIHLLSSLNAPLDAEIELIGATPEELAALRTQIASRDTFARYKLDWPSFMGGITVQPLRTADGRDVIKLRSTEAITEPFVTLLVEANWARGRLVREYTMLLDPPVYTPGQRAGESAPVAAPVTQQSDRIAPVSRPAEPSRPSVPQATPPAPTESKPTPATAVPSPAPEQPTATPAKAPAASAAGSTRLVRGGDTLSAIARDVAGSDQSAVRRWMLAIYRANPRAFDGNMNILRRGAELRIPDRAAAESVSAQEASAEIRQQYAAWREGTGTASESNAEPARLRLVPPKDTGATPSSATTAAGDKADQQGAAGIGEAQSEDARKLALRNAELARLQGDLAAKQGQQADAAAPPAPSASEEMPAEQPAEAAAPSVEPAPPVEQTPAVTPAPVKSKAPAAKPSPAEPESSLLDTLMNYWWALAAVLIAIAALLGVRVWRSRQQAEFDDSLGRLATAGGPSMGRAFDESVEEVGPVRIVEPEPNIVVEETGVHERPRFAAEAAAAPAARTVSADDTISSDTAINLDQGDPLAEADFHMAYGLYDQAADLVRIAISREPERRDLKLKLLEVFFVWGNKDRFLETAHELAGSREHAAPGEWEKIVIMGKQIAPEDSLFASGAHVGGAAMGGVDLDLEGGQSRVDFDPLSESASTATGVDLDIGSALGEGDKERTVESPARGDATSVDFALQDMDFSGNAATQQMTQRIELDEPAPLMPEFGLENTEVSTVEQPGIQGNPALRQKVDMALRQSGVEQTAELNIDDLGLDLTEIEALNQPVSDDAATGSSIEATEAVSFDFDAMSEESSATLPDHSHAATQKIDVGDLALPDLEPATMSEVGTKLDLARAYMDMGDPEGARNILEEVLQEGSVAQKQEAQRLMESLPG